MLVSLGDIQVVFTVPETLMVHLAVVSDFFLFKIIINSCINLGWIDLGLVWHISNFYFHLLILSLVLCETLMRRELNSNTIQSERQPKTQF